MIKGLLDDPSTVSKLRSLVGEEKPPPPKAEQDELSKFNIDPKMMLKITSAMQKMNGKQNDDRTRLLCDLKPYISHHRRRRVDEAIEILRMLWLVDMFKEGGGDFEK